MRRMLLPEVKIKSKVKDDTFNITLEELLPYFNETDSIQSVIIQPINQSGYDDSNIILEIVGSPNTIYDITNQIVTIGYDGGGTLMSAGLLFNKDTNQIELSLYKRNIDLEDVRISSTYQFDLYIIKK